MGLPFGSDGAHTYLKSGQVAPPPSPPFTCLREKSLPRTLAGVLFLSLQEVEKISQTLMQVWITGYHGFLPEAIGLFVVDSGQTRLNYTSCFGQQTAIFFS